MRLGWLSVLAAGALSAGALAQSGARPLDDSQPPELASDEGVGALRRRMTRHGGMLDALTRATLAVDRPRIAELAGALARDTGLGAWPGPDAGTAGRGQLDRLEVQLRTRARVLADVAWSGDDERLATTFAGVMETCVACHERTLPGKPAR
jgi:hypothetical protein